MYASRLFRYGTMCCALILAGTAQADDQVTSQEFSVSLEADKPGSPVSEELFVTAFDPALGTLTGVSVQIDAGVAGSWGVENLAEKERIAVVGGGARLGLFVGSNRKLMSLAASDFESGAMTGFDGTEDWRGSSAEHGKFSADELQVHKFDPTPGWIKAPTPNGVPLTLELLVGLSHESQMSGCIRAESKVTIRVEYSYDDGQKSPQLDDVRAEAHTPEPIHARRVDRERSDD